MPSTSAPDIDQQIQNIQKTIQDLRYQREKQLLDRSLLIRCDMGEARIAENLDIVQTTERRIKENEILLGGAMEKKGRAMERKN